MIVVRDERDPEAPVERTFAHRGGIAEFAEHLSTGEAVSPVLRLAGSGNFTETVPVLDKRGHMVPTEVERELVVDVALRWGNHYDTEMRSFVNIVATPKGGTHVAGFERALVKTLNDYATSAKVLRASEGAITKEDALEGATAVITVRLAEPQFEGQTKEILGTPAASRIVAGVVSKELTAWLTNPPRGDKLVVKAVAEKVANAMRARVAARTHRDVQRRKNALESSSMPAKLVDCRSEDLERTELFIVEGNSALGTAKLARDSEFQALLPIRGKILNVHKASLADMLKNAECAAIIQVLGAGSGRTFDIEALRYSKVILMADADVDGAHIRCLLLTLFHRYMPQMLAEGRVYSAVPPLHRVEVIASGGKKAEVRYTHSDAELKATLAELTQGRAPVEGPPALQGPRRDGRQPAARDHHGAGQADAAPGAGRGCARRGHGVRPADGLRRRAAQGVHRGRVGRPGPRPHRRLSRRPNSGVDRQQTLPCPRRTPHRRPRGRGGAAGSCGSAAGRAAARPPRPRRCGTPCCRCPRRTCSAIRAWISSSAVPTILQRVCGMTSTRVTSEQVRGQHERAQDVVGDPGAGVAQDLDVARRHPDDAAGGRSGSPCR